MLSSSLDTLLKVSKTTSPQKLFSYDCVIWINGFMIGLYNMLFGPRILDNPIYLLWTHDLTSEI